MIYPYCEDQIMKAIDLLEALAKKLETNSQLELASAIGVTVQTLINWKKRNEDLSPNQIASAIAKSQTAAVQKSQHQTIRPVVEFYGIDRCLSKREANWQVFEGGRKLRSMPAV